MDQWAHIQKVFDEALQQPPEQRGDFVAQMCGENQELQREVESLLEAHEASESFMEHPVVAEIAEIVQHATRAFQPGQALGGYRITDWIGRGGMGEVYRARDTRLKRDVAIKTLPRDFATDAERLRRFEQEARAAAALNHPNIVSVYDMGVLDGRPYIVSEFLVGQTLRDLLNAGPIPIPKALDLATQLTHGLAAAHDSGIVHRDLKPENLFVIKDGRLKVLDFGLAKLTRAAFDPDCSTNEGLFETEMGRIFGTLGYMSPEQTRGQRADHRSDIFSAGAILYELFSGKKAFQGESPADIITAILHLDPPELLNLEPPPVNRTIRRALEKNAQKRFQSAHELAFQLQEASRGLSSHPDSNRMKRDRESGKAAIASTEMHSNQPPELANSELPAKQTPRHEPPSTSAVVITAATAHKWSFAAVAVFVLFVITTAGLGIHSLVSNGGSPAVRSARNDSKRRILAVIPFENISADRSHDYFSAGMTEEINGQLSKMASLQVLSQTAVSRYKDPRSNLRKIAEQLGVGSVVIGSVRRAGSHARINVELVDPRDDRTVWSEQYDRELKDIFAVQSDVALRIAEALQATLSVNERERVEKRPTENLEAYQLYLRSQELSQGDRQQNLQAVRMLEEAVQKDPKFAVAQAAIAYRQIFQASFDDARYIDFGMEMARKALAQDPNLARAHFALAAGYSRKGQAANARLSLLKTMELDPNSSRAMMNLSVQEIDLGQFDEALHWARRAFRLVPNWDNAYYHVGAPLIEMGDDVATERWLTEGERRFAGSLRLQILLAMLDCLRGKDREALERARKANAVSPNDEEVLYLLADLALITGGPDMETLLERFFRSAPDLSGGYWVLPESFRVKYAYALARRGETQRAAQLMDEAVRLAREALETGDELPRARMEIAAVHAFRKQKTPALEWLEKAYDAGWRESRRLARDPMFDSVRQQPKFKELILRINKDVARMRERSSDLRALSTDSAAKISSR
jgi:eukaryotic-like serine/threonine-protein kinase